MTLLVYLMSAILLLLAALVIFRIFHRRDYQRRGRLTLFSMISSALIFFSWGGFPYIYGPSDWPEVHVVSTIGVIGWFLLVGGLVIMFTAMVSLGLLRSCGQGGEQLKQTGFYRLTRNPQVMGCTLCGMGFALLWPSWYALGWVILLVVTLHVMVLTEEEHLKMAYGEVYERYCEQVPRYLGIAMIRK